MQHLTYVDYGIMIIIALYAIKGFSNGAIYELFSLLGIAFGLHLAFKYASPLGSYLDKHIIHFNNATLSAIIAAIVIFAGIMIASFLLSSVLGKLISFARFQPLNRLLGALFSMFKCFLFISLTIYIIGQLPVVNDLIAKIDKHSAIYPYMRDVANWALDINTYMDKEEAASKASGAIDDTSKSITSSIQDAFNSAKSAAKDAAKALK